MVSTDLLDGLAQARSGSFVEFRRLSDAEASLSELWREDEEPGELLFEIQAMEFDVSYADNPSTAAQWSVAFTPNFRKSAASADKTT